MHRMPRNEGNLEVKLNIKLCFLYSVEHTNVFQYS